MTTTTNAKTTCAQQAAAAARNGDYENAYLLYSRAAIAADIALDSAKSKRNWKKADHFSRIVENAAQRRSSCNGYY